MEKEQYDYLSVGSLLLRSDGAVFKLADGGEVGDLLQDATPLGVYLFRYLKEASVFRPFI